MGTHSSAMSRRPLGMMIVAVVMGLMIATLGLALGAEKAWAGYQPYGGTFIENLKTKSSMTTTMKSSEDKYRSLNSKKYQTRKISNAKSSNPNVATVKAGFHKYSGKRYYYMFIELKGKGTTYLTFKWGSKKYKVKYMVKDYVNPLKSFKIGKTQYASEFAPEKQHYYQLEALGKGKTLSGKLKVKLAKGWKLEKAWYRSGSNYKVIKNGGKVKKASSVWIVVKKGSLRERMDVFAQGNVSTSSVAVTSNDATGADATGNAGASGALRAA